MTKKVIKMMLNNTGCVQDEKNQLLTTCMWFNLVWTDYQLSWNSSEYGDVDSVVIQPRNQSCQPTLANWRCPLLGDSSALNLLKHLC